MKKILLASTILVGTAGVAAADTANVSFSGSAGFGVAYNTTTATLTPTTSSSFTAGMSTTTDMGLEAGAANDAADLRVDYAFGDYSVYAQVNAAELGGWSADSIDFGGTAAMSGFSLGVDATYTITGGAIEWKATAGYASGAYSVSAFVQDDNGVDATNFDYGLSGSYDLGGGVSVDAGYTYDNDLNTGLATVGVSMTF
ncbi:MAG: hypothetical protein P8X69_02555 [Maritimibacter sp.]